MDLERNRSIFLYHGFMIDLNWNLFHGPGTHWESGFRFRFVTLSYFAVTGLCLFTSRLIPSGPHACPSLSPCPHTF
jgi:hypothetical protein